jgi:putative tricarboxylic transport membrane protein
MRQALGACLTISDVRYCMRLSDRTTGLFLVGLGVLAAYGGSRLPPVPGQPVGPNIFPLVIGIGTAICGAMIAFGIGHKFEEEAEADLAAHTDTETIAEAQRPRSFFWYLRALIPPALLLFYVYAVDLIGFIPTAATLIFIAAVALGASLRLAVPLAMLAPVGVHLIFYKLLRVPLPDGYLPMPWS